MKFKIFKTVIFLISTLSFALSPLVPQTFADANPCPSGILFEQNGQVYCTQMINLDANTNIDNSYPNNGIAGQGINQGNDWGYNSANYNFNDSSNGFVSSPTSCTKLYLDNTYSSSTNINNSLPPYLNYGGGYACQENPNLQGFPVCNGSAANHLPTGNACVYVQLNYKGSVYQLFYCDKNITQICGDNTFAQTNGIDNFRTVEVYTEHNQFADDAHGVGYNPDALKFFCNQVTGVGTGNQGTNTPPPANNQVPPVQLVNFPPLSYCCNNKTEGNTDDGNIKGTDDIVPVSDSHIINSQGTCFYTPDAPKGVLNCADPNYNSQHTAECSCIYDSTAKSSNGNTYTALGCIPGNFGQVINIFISIAIGLAALVALIMMLIGGYEIMTNPAGPDEIKEGQQYITNAVLGLILIIFCIVILKIIGIDILHIGTLSTLF